ncbi:hypothetical protein [Microbacterium sp. GCS4]|uniref:hypothetical protein n=1 Tax=Microbacterium sp. GCS4 TaxID=1692239 RepID=UPI00068311BF|nr:hypothetical protein [Microbacterium sp. GCS4]KNY05428.1 hypothetical protein AKH00_13900 [Microbacterium sp. GCS4]
MTELIKAVTPARGRAWLSQGLGWVSGYVVRRDDVLAATTPSALFAELGLGFPESPFTPDAPHIDTLRIPAASYLALQSPGTRDVVPPFRDHPPTSGTGFVESASAMVPYWWLAPSALPAGTSLWRTYADGREEILAGYANVAEGWVSVRPDFGLPAVPVRSPELVGIWAEVAGERMLADVLPDGQVIVCSPQQREDMQQSARGVWWRHAVAEEVERIFAVRVVGRWRNRRVQLVGAERGESGDRAHIVFLGHDAIDAESLGLTKSDAGVYEGVVAAAEVADLNEEQTEVSAPRDAAGIGG